MSATTTATAPAVYVPNTIGFRPVQKATAADRDVTCLEDDYDFSLGASFVPGSAPAPESETPGRDFAKAMKAARQRADQS